MATMEPMTPDGKRDAEPADRDSFADNEGEAHDIDMDDIAQLDLGDDDASLPWLEADDDEDEFAGYETGQLIGLAMLGILALMVIAGGAWWIMRDNSGEHLVADGGVIEAPKQPYKEKPENPGGKTFDGTGDSSFAVSEGQQRPAQLAKEVEVPKPGFESVDKPAPTAQPEAPGAAVQVAAYTSRSMAEAGWNQLSAQYSALKGMRYRIVQGKADFGTVYRLQALPGDADAATALCTDLKVAGLNCNVK